MKETHQVYQGIADLLDTMEQALFHIPAQLYELRLEESFTLLTNFTDALRSIEESNTAVMPGMNLKGREMLHQSLTAAVEAYQNSEIEKIKEVIATRLLPAFGQWKAELKKPSQGEYILASS